MNRSAAMYSLVHHEPGFSKEELLINPEAFPPAQRPKAGDILEIVNPDNNKKLYLPVKSLSPPVKGKISCISIAHYIATVFAFVAHRDVHVRVVTPDQAHVDFVELSFKDQYIGRSDMWRLRVSLLQTCAFVLKKISFSCIRAQVEEMVIRGQKGFSGFITADTKFVFRSRSAKFVIYIQMSKEMWEFADDGDLYFEKAVHGFLKELFDRWKALGTNHSFTIILFSRMLFDNCDIADIPKEFTNVHTDIDGRRFQDFYKVVINDETRTDFDSVIIQLKKEFNEYPSHIHWDPYCMFAGERRKEEREQKEEGVAL